ncbi:MAG: hypothetical protein K9J13_00655 [Saprospiraceae bacterium]|nr:hypothetical protein [Saprospiraceae bacterium]
MENVTQIVFKVLKDYLTSQEIVCELDNDSILYGADGILDSMGIVNIIVDLESYFSGAGYQIDLTSEKALSLQNSPFQSISTITEFIKRQL